MMALQVFVYLASLGRRGGRRFPEIEVLGAAAEAAKFVKG
jgi:hypothetical protein